MIVSSTTTTILEPLAAAAATRPILHRTFGRRGFPITRLVSPSDWGQILKPFVFLDIFGGPGDAFTAMDSMPLHPHSGIATITVITEGHLFFQDVEAGTKGKIDYGGVEWMRASSGVWHGKEMSVHPHPPPQLKGFQLWTALPPELENAEAVSRYIEAKDMPTIGPATIIVGDYQGVKSPVPAPSGYNYLLVTLQPGETWTYTPPQQHTIAWLAVSKGELVYGTEKPILSGELVIFDRQATELPLSAATTTTTFVLGSAIPHPHDLHLGMYSVHTSAQALKEGEQTIRELEMALGDRKYAAGPLPVFKKGM